MRLFIALELPTAVIIELEQMQQHLRRGAQHPVKWVGSGGFHLTLQFLGEVAAEQVPAILSALEYVTSTTAGSTGPVLHLAAAGAFPNLRQPQALWVGVGGDTALLAQLQQAVTRAMEPLGFVPESRPFRAHLTLGRVRREATAQERSRLGAALSALPAPEPIAWPMGRPMLFQSTLTPDGALYRRISYE